MIDFGHTNKAGEAITLRPVTAENWRAIADVAPSDEQRRFVPALAARYLLVSTREGVWHSLGICADERVVGHAMWGYDEQDGAHWIGGVLIAADEQGTGSGRAAMLTLIEWLRREQAAGPIRLSHQAENVPAARLYEQLGFRLTGELEGDELIAELRPDDLPSEGCDL
jgi:diamine N-acetyltransferase